MNFTDAVKACFQKYATFTGRSGKPEFWWFFLFQIAVYLVTGMVSEMLYLIAALALVLPSLAVGARRLHDIGKSAWLLLVGLIPFVGFLVLIYWFIQPSAGANQYGSLEASPEAPTVMPGQ
ncbi:MAG TPA: DUF805 domain-containing protein [Ramlibacter sp.]|jgi:uncharacterized membrane protein YhaH (DUF805 family)